MGKLGVLLCFHLHLPQGSDQAFCSGADVVTLHQLINEGLLCTLSVSDLFWLKFLFLFLILSVNTFKSKDFQLLDLFKESSTLKV